MTSPESTATIDDLLRYVEESEAPARRRPTGIGWLVRTAVIAAALTVVTVFGLRYFGLDLSVVGVFAGYLAVLLVRRVAGPLAPPTPPRDARRRRGERTDEPDRPAGHDALRSAMHGWEQRLMWSESNASALNRVVLPRIRELADERLRQRHGLTRASDPARARQLLGEPAWTLLDGNNQPTPTLAELSAIAARLEKI